MEKEKQKGLVIVDMINGFVKKGVLADPFIGTITPEIVRLAKGYMENGDKVFAFRDAHDENCAEFGAFPPHCVKGTPEVELVDELKAVEGLEQYAQIIDKNSTSGFVAPGFLEAIKGLDEIAIVGCCTDICIMNLAIPLKNWYNQFNIDANVVVPENAVETYNIPGVHERDEWNQMAMKFMKQAGVEIVKCIELGKRKQMGEINRAWAKRIEKEQKQQND